MKEQYNDQMSNTTRMKNKINETLKLVIENEKTFSVD
jgi:hypothetical protein